MTGEPILRFGQESYAIAIFTQVRVLAGGLLSYKRKGNTRQNIPYARTLQTTCDISLAEDNIGDTYLGGVPSSVFVRRTLNMAKLSLVGCVVVVDIQR